jgi:type IV secretory pathway TrbF-like protein
MEPFAHRRSPTSSIATHTPYQHAAQVWDARMGLTLQHARNWRLMAFAAAGLAAFLGAGWWMQAGRATVTPYIVEIDSYGQTQRITAANGVWRPNEAQVGYFLADWIRLVRSKPVDQVVIRQNWLRAYDLATPRTSAFLNAFAAARDPFANVGHEAITVEVLNVIPRSEHTFDLQWREETFLNGQRARTERWRALITVRQQPPRTEAELRRNPLGLRIEDVSWNLDAQ